MDQNISHSEHLNFDKLAKALDDSIHHQIAKSSMGISPIAIAIAMNDWLMHLSVSPGKQSILMRKGVELTADLIAKNWNPSSNTSNPIVLDARFHDPAWDQYPFSSLRDIYLAHHDWWSEVVHVDGVAKHHDDLVSFYCKQFLDALSPSNYSITNPEFFKLSYESLGKNWFEGFNSYMSDLLTHPLLTSERINHDSLKLPFEPGKDVAVTPGAVVYENDLIELIQYAPSTREVFSIPILIVPSCIMKYYILDLSPDNSMVKYLVDQGFTVFMISWKNPEASDRNVDFADYLKLGVMASLREIKKIAACDEVHAIGYCLGGTFLSVVSAYLGHYQSADIKGEQNKKRESLIEFPRLASTTLLAAQTDFSDPGQLGLLIDEDQLRTLRIEMSRTGYLSGKQMAASFQFLNARDLVWSKNTKRYLLGVNESATDMTSWNADVTRLPEKMHLEYLNKLFLNNELSMGYFQFEGHGIALMDIKSPLLVVGTERDTVSPWRSVYKIHLLTNVDTTFILASGGHNAGIISEPGHPKRSYHIHSVNKGHGWLDPSGYLERSDKKDGSWWPAMRDWLVNISDALVPAREIGKKMTLRKAPGKNVLVRYVD
jgi:polyhydroxyalkanoate synthase